MSSACQAIPDLEFLLLIRNCRHGGFLRTESALGLVFVKENLSRYQQLICIFLREQGLVILAT
jgi:hypothetical protein